jgi:hypothetical protein
VHQSVPFKEKTQHQLYKVKWLNKSTSGIFIIIDILMIFFALSFFILACQSNSSILPKGIQDPVLFTRIEPILLARVNLTDFLYNLAGFHRKNLNHHLNSLNGIMHPSRRFVIFPETDFCNANDFFKFYPHECLIAIENIGDVGLIGLFGSMITCHSHISFISKISEFYLMTRVSIGNPSRPAFLQFELIFSSFDKVICQIIRNSRDSYIIIRKKLELIISLMSSISLSFSKIKIPSSGKVSPKFYIEVLTLLTDAIDEGGIIPLLNVYLQIDLVNRKNNGILPSNGYQKKKTYLLCFLLFYYGYQFFHHGPFEEEDLGQLSAYPKLIAIMCFHDFHNFKVKKLFDLFSEKDIIKIAIACPKAVVKLPDKMARGKLLTLLHNQFDSINCSQKFMWNIKVYLALYEAIK